MSKFVLSPGSNDEQQRKEVVNLLGQFLSDVKEGKIQPLTIEHTRKTIGVPDRGVLFQCLTGIENISVEFTRPTTQEDNS